MNEEIKVPKVIKTLHIITGLNDGGAEAVLYRLCLNDTESRHCVVSLMDEGKYGPLLRRAGVRVHALGMPRGKCSLRGLCALWRILRAEKPQVVQTWMYHADLIGGVVARLAGIPRVYWGIRNNRIDQCHATSSTPRVARLCARLSRMIPKKIICCSQEAAEAHKALGYRAGKFIVIPNGYDLSRFAPDGDARQKLRVLWGIPPKVPLLGMVARYDSMKDHGNLLDALEKLRRSGHSFQCLLVGTGMEKTNKELCFLLEERQLVESVRLLGQQNNIPQIMNALDVHVLSSSSEAFPNVLAEAMACGTPCVTTDVGDAAFIVGDTGWVVLFKNSQALYEGICQALEAMKDPHAWERRKKLARERIQKNFSLSRMIEKYEEAWRE